MLTRFGKFELDSRRYELTCEGRVVKLERIPMKLLFFLAESKGALVSREAIAEHLWGKDVFVDAQHSVNTAINKLRTALHDDLADPKFIQTVKGMGYRFVAEVEVCPEASAALAQPATLTPSNGGGPEAATVDSGQETTVIMMTATDFAADDTIPSELEPDRLTESSDSRQSVSRRPVAVPEEGAPKLRKITVPVLVVLFVALLAAGGLYYRWHRSQPLTDKDTIVLADFANSTGDAIFDDTLKTALNVSLRQSPFLNVLPDGQVAKTEFDGAFGGRQTHARGRPRALSAGGQQSLHCRGDWQSGQRICPGVEGNELPERSHVGRGADDGGVQGEGAGRAG